MVTNPLLTEREKQIAQMLMESSYREHPMPQYGLSSQALRQTKSEICKKMECEDIREALAKAQAQGLV